MVWYADDRHRLGCPELPVKMTGRTCAAVEVAQIEQRRRAAPDHAETRRSLFEYSAHQHRKERRLVPRRHPRVDASGRESHAFDCCGQCLDRMVWKFVGMFFA